MKKRKTLSGMTLVEMIISLAVFAALALVLVTMGSNVERNTRAANSLNKKVAVDGPIAESHNKNASYLVNKDYEIQVADKAQLVTNDSGEYVKGFVGIKGTMYYVDPAKEQQTDGDGNAIEDKSASADDFTFKYVVIPPTQPTSSTTSTETTTTTQNPGNI